MSIQPDGKPSTLTLAMVREYTDKLKANHLPAMLYFVDTALADVALRPRSADHQVEAYIEDMHATNDRAEAKIAELTLERDTTWICCQSQVAATDQMRAERDDAWTDARRFLAQYQELMTFVGEQDATIAAKDARIAELKSELATRPAAFADPVEEPLKHDPFREFPSDRRRVGG